MSHPLPADDAGSLERSVRHLVAVSEGDPLAPFALRPDKKYVFAPDGTAAIGYKVKLRVAVASGDPVGSRDGWESAIEAFVAQARARRLSFAVLGAGEHAQQIWSQYGLGHLAIGRDVVLQRSEFTLSGRRFRNVRQAVQRSRNAGITVEILREGDLRPEQILELRGLMRAARKEDTRGFSMILGRMFDGREPDAVIAVARDGDGTPVSAHRYLWAGKQDLSLDLPIRSRTAPNGVDERIVAEVVEWGAAQGVERVSLAFAPFPDLFGNRADLGLLARVGSVLVHVFDPLIKVERLYRYLRKFHAFDQQRFVMLRWRQVVRVGLAFLILEFST